MKGLSLFTGAGIGETYLNNCGIDIIVGNELVPRRADLYMSMHPECNMICGDITDDTVFNEILLASRGIDFLIASPPCQGMSVAGRNRQQHEMSEDPRNYLITRVFSAIEELSPQYILIENVPMLLKLKLCHKNKFRTVEEILTEKFGSIYNIDAQIVDAADYGVPQTRLRAIIKMYPKDKHWPWPNKLNDKTTVRDTIGHLPSLEAGESSDIRWHYARPHDPRHILWMKHTATGTSAFSNKIYFPQKADGTRIRGYESSYRRIEYYDAADPLFRCVLIHQFRGHGTIVPTPGPLLDRSLISPVTFPH